jgi:2,4-dienoyl-CoA reductase-like NADH-dependent reductase (Old Yellow Enzyme family)
MSEATPHTTLGQALTLRCGAVLSNRIAKAAMSEQLAREDGAPSEGLIRLYQRWAPSGAGVLLTGNVMVDRRALAEPGNAFVEDDRHLPLLKSWAAAARSGGGGHVWMQINHPGRQCPKTMTRDPVAPSAVPVKIAGQFAVPRALTSAEIQDIVGRFARTAGIAREAGFTGVQIHGAHGYLVSQFLSPRANLREDDWGGDPERRRRFLLEVVRAVRARVGPDFPVAVKLNSADFQRGGFTEEDSMAVVEALEREAVDLLEISGGTYESTVMFLGSAKESTRQREAYFQEYAEKVRARTKLPLMVTGGFRTAAGMAGAIAEGSVDVVGLARPMALEPDLPARLLSGQSTRSAAERRKVGLRMLDALAENQWYLQQLHLMAAGRDPDARRGTIKSLLIGLYQTSTGARIS